jgi:hypothetical protein
VNKKGKLAGSSAAIIYNASRKIQRKKGEKEVRDEG